MKKIQKTWKILNQKIIYYKLTNKSFLISLSKIAILMKCMKFRILAVCMESPIIKSNNRTKSINN